MSNRDSTETDAHDAADVPIEVSLDAEDEGPPVESNTRIDILVETETYPTARLDDGRYVAWWFTADAPEPDDPAASEWVTAPTRFLAAGTLHELWENPRALDSLAAQG
ncbi:MAG: hypothetical protein ACI8UR_001613 [Natronomonas sp.]|jgi:hypothetical protein|uniref:hypothetical protein n=1 Tax=Natronomonas sp. TaxID=2184060 RepID=UPI0039894F0D